MTLLTSSIFGAAISIRGSKCVILTSGEFSSTGLFNNPSKSSTHLSHLSSTGHSNMPYFLLLFSLYHKVLSYFFLSQLFSAVVDRSSTYFRLSAWMLRFTRLFASMYRPCLLVFVALVQLSLSIAFLFYCSWILPTISAEIHCLSWFFLWSSTSWHVEVVFYLIPFQSLTIMISSFVRFCGA